MKHDIVLEGWNCRLRPVGICDAEFIVNLRNQDFANGFIHATDRSIARQIEWIESYFQRENDYYWIVENISQNRAVGTYGLYNFNGGMAMPGRMLLTKDADILPAVLPVLLREFAFEKLGLTHLVGCVVPTNKKVLKFSKTMGSEMMTSCPDAYRQIDEEIRQVWFRFEANKWPENKAKWYARLGPR